MLNMCALLLFFQGSQNESKIFVCSSKSRLFAKHDLSTTLKVIDSKVEWILFCLFISHFHWIVASFFVVIYVILLIFFCLCILTGEPAWMQPLIFCQLESRIWHCLKLVVLCIVYFLVSFLCAYRRNLNFIAYSYNCKFNVITLLSALNIM